MWVGESSSDFIMLTVIERLSAEHFLDETVQNRQVLDIGNADALCLLSQFVPKNLNVVWALA